MSLTDVHVAFRFGLDFSMQRDGRRYLRKIITIILFPMIISIIHSRGIFIINLVFLQASVYDAARLKDLIQT
jgi:hypothetical protein